jgi:hypothetical protein
MCSEHERWSRVLLRLMYDSASTCSISSLSSLCQHPYDSLNRQKVSLIRCVCSGEAFGSVHANTSSFARRTRDDAAGVCAPGEFAFGSIVSGFTCSTRAIIRRRSAEGHVGVVSVVDTQDSPSTFCASIRHFQSNTEEHIHRRILRCARVGCA